MGRTSQRATPRPCSPRCGLLDEGKAFYTDLKGRLARYGRRPDELKVLPGIVPFIGSTEAEAQALEQEFTDLISPDYALRQLSNMLGIDLTAHALDAPLPPLPPEAEIQGNKSRYRLVKELAAKEDLDSSVVDRAPRWRSRAPHVRGNAGPDRRRTRSRGSPRALPTDSTSCRRICRVVSRISSPM